MDILSDILSAMRAAGSVDFCDRLNAPWAMDFSDTERASFHLVRRGECWLSSGDALERLGPGDLAFVAAGRDHRLSSEPLGATPTSPSSETLRRYKRWGLSRCCCAGSREDGSLGQTRCMIYT